MNETLASMAFIVDRLTGAMPSDDADALHNVVGDRVYPGIAPEGTAYPLVSVQTLSSRDTIVAGGQTAFLTIDIATKVVGTGGYEELGIADEAIFRMLHLSHGDIDSACHVMGCHRVSSTLFERAEGSTIYRTVQSRWRIRTYRIPA